MAHYFMQQQLNASSFQHNPLPIALAGMVGTSRNLLSCKQYRPIRNPMKMCFCNFVRILACTRNSEEKIRRNRQQE